MSAVPKTMKAWLVTKVGPPKDALEFKPDWPVPTALKKDDIMVRVAYAALNPLDLVLMQNWYPFRKPAFTAVDFVGEVIQAGSNVPDHIKVGMTVCGTVPTLQIFKGNGVLAEYLVVPGHAAAEKPPGVDEPTAVGLMGVAGQTATVVVESAKLSKGVKVLLNGASGGVGTILTQVLNAKGVDVTAICSKRNEDTVLRLGAKQTIDYTAPGVIYDRLASQFSDKPFDLVIDCIGDEKLYKKSSGFLKKDGKFMTFAGSFASAIKLSLQPAILGGGPRQFVRVNNNPAGARAKEVASWYEAGWVTEIPIEVFTMDQVLEAYEKLATKHAKGKLIVKVA